ncbi:MAG: MerR family transcriptional regulator [Lachnospiraceae bacterium]|nr:MerR family transcriptional regulator [Lachnospiraceae bacterium]
MLSIGEFSNICKVSTKTLRYYAEIGLLEPSVINPENGYRYYDIEQLETMLFINRLKTYSFSLDEIKGIMQSNESQEEILYHAFLQKKQEIEKQVVSTQRILNQLDGDILTLKQGKSIMSYMDDIDIQLVEMPTMHLLSIRKMVQSDAYPKEYADCFGKLFKKVAVDRLTMAGAPMVLFHSDKFVPSGLDTEFAIPVKGFVTGTRDFCPGLCIKTVVHGPYTELSSVYAKQREWAEKEGYQCRNAVFEVYVTDPSQVVCEQDNITEVYYPVKKLSL